MTDSARMSVRTEQLFEQATPSLSKDKSCQLEVLLSTYMGDFLSASRETSGSMGACSNWCPASPFDLGSSLLTKEVVIGWSGGSYRNPHPSKPTLGEP